MLQKVRDWFSDTAKPILIPHTNRNVLIITAFVNKGIVTVSYKGQDRRALFEDNTLKKLMRGEDFDKMSFNFFHAVAQLLLPLIKK